MIIVIFYESCLSVPNSQLKISKATLLIATRTCSCVSSFSVPCNLLKDIRENELHASVRDSLVLRVCSTETNVTFSFKDPIEHL